MLNLAIFLYTLIKYILYDDYVFDENICIYPHYVHIESVKGSIQVWMVLYGE